jgi:predicted membrane protein
MNDKNHDHNSALTALTVGYLGWILYEVGSIFGVWPLLGKLFRGIGFIIKWAFIVFAVYIGGLLVIAILSLIPPTVYKIILVFLIGYISWKGYNHSIDKWKNKEKVAKEKEFEIENKRKLSEALEFLQPWLHNLHVHYYDSEKEQFVEWLFRCRQLIYFHTEWDDARRLQKMGEVTGKFYVCHLSTKPAAWTKEGKEYAWQQKRREQSERDLKRNAELKAARKSLIKVVPGV